MTPFEQQGCDYCRERWIYRSDEPRFIGESGASRFLRCGRCGSFWEQGFDYPRVVDEQVVIDALGDSPDTAG